MRHSNVLILLGVVVAAGALWVAGLAWSESIDRTQNPNNANAGIAKSLAQQIGAGRGDVNTPDSSAFIIARDPARAVRRGRQLFQRKFLRDQGQGPLFNDGEGDINVELRLGAGLADSCAGCHGRPKGSAGFGGDVATRPDSRDAPHLFGLGLKEMLADEITADLRKIRDDARREALRERRDVTESLTSKGIRYGSITARRDGSIDTSKVDGVDPDLRVRPFFVHGGTISIREFAVGAFQAEMGLQAVDPDLATACKGGRIVTPSGMVLDGSKDVIECPPTADPNADLDGDGVKNEIPTSLVDFMEFYLLNYFKAGRGDETSSTRRGRDIMANIGCTKCHVPDLKVERDRRVADVETVHDPERGNPFNRLFATATTLFTTFDDRSGLPTIKKPNQNSFVVKNIFTDFKRHDLGPNFHERNYDGTIRTQFLTTALWGVGTTAPYGHDGRSHDLTTVILRHGGQAQRERNLFAALGKSDVEDVLEFLRSLILFGPDDTASNLQPATPATAGYPQFGHGSIALTPLFNNPNDPE
jgi:Di-haem oxidoreductase, putative peroxidase